MNKSKRFLSLFAFVGLGVSFFAFNQAKIKDKEEFAKPGMVAYAASYSDSTSDEPQFPTQNSKTFQYLNLGEAHDYYRGDSVKVGIIDSGINYDHEDFMVNDATKVKGDSKYYAYQSTQWVYYKASQHGYSYIDDTLGHGTNVAATVAAAVNSIGGVGLAPNVELYVYKVTNSSNGYEFGAIQNALMDAKTLGLDVINMSFQSYENAVTYNGSTMSASSGCSTILTTYLNQAYNAGITLVGAAGNYNTSEPSYPGSNNHVINVGSLNSTGDGKAGFSNYGSTIDLVAPGYVYVADEASNNAYTNTQGTSFSAPLVTAAIALYIQQNPSATPDEIESALYASCDPIESGSTYSNWAGNGSLNVEKFLGLDSGGDILDSISVSPTSVSLQVDGTQQLTVTGYFHDGSDRELSFDDYEVMGSSNDESVCTISESGVITAVGPGETTIDLLTDQQSLELSVPVTVTASGGSTETLTITRSSFATAGGYAWYDWSGSTTDSTSISGKGELYTTETGSMQFNKNKGNKVAAIFNTTAIPGAITKIEAKTASGTERAWNAYVTSTACSASGSTLTFGSNKTTVGSNVTVSTTTTSLGTSSSGYSFFCLQENETSASYLAEIKISYTPSAPKTLTSITLDTTNVKKSFYVGDTFSTSGLVVTAHYDDSSTADVTSRATITTPDMSSSGQKTVSVSFGGKSASYNITVNAVNLSSISVSGQKTSFGKNSAFSFGGVVTANYNSGATKDVTSSSSFSGYDMSLVGNQTVTVSYTEGGVTKTTSYSITVNNYRVVMEASTIEGQVTWPSSATATITGSITGLSASVSGKTVYESSSMRLGTGSGGGTLTISASVAISSLKISAKYYSSSYSSSALKVDGQSVSPLTASYADYTVTLSSAKTSFTIKTDDSSNRVNIQRVTLYVLGPEEDIGQTEDCIGLESYISDYLHMEYDNDKGWCNDTGHNYYGKNTDTGAKAGFNALNDHQRKLFTTNSAYSVEWFRLSEWARINGDALDSNNYLSTKTSGLNHSILNSTYTSAFVVIGTVVLTSVGLYFLLKKRHEKENS